jgi:hypothetical protein
MTGHGRPAIPGFGPRPPNPLVQPTAAAWPRRP